MKFSELKGRAVVRLDDARKLGEVADLLVDPLSGRIESLKLHTGLLRAAELIAPAAVQNIGADAVTVSGAATPEAPRAAGAPPLVELTRVLGAKVVTDAGAFVGELHDVLFDWATLTITGYEVRGAGLFAQARQFAATPEVRFGEQLITLPAHLLRDPA
jgi:uncharacterized protein YrrD